MTKEQRRILANIVNDEDIAVTGIEFPSHSNIGKRWDCLKVGYWMKFDGGDIVKYHDWYDYEGNTVETTKSDETYDNWRRLRREEGLSPV